MALACRQHTGEILQILLQYRFIQTYLDSVSVIIQIDTVCECSALQVLNGVRICFEPDGIKKMRAVEYVTQRLSVGSKLTGLIVYLASNALEPVCAMPGGIHTCHNGQQRLSSTDIGSGFFAANMLLARLQRHTQCPVALAVDRNTNDTAWYQPLVVVVASKKCRMRPSVPHGHTEALAVAHDSVGTPLARRAKQGQRQQITGYGHIHPGSLGPLGERPVIRHSTRLIRVLK